MAGIPLSDDYQVRRVPVVTYLLVAVNVLVYLLSPQAATAVWYASDPLSRLCDLNVYFLRWGAVPAELLTGEQLPARQGCPGADFDKHIWFSPVSAMFLHSEPAHLLGNMVYLFVFGPVVEDRLGRLRFLGVYLATGVLATYAFALTEAGGTTPLVGASGAVSGVLGAYLVVQFRSRVTTLVLFVLPVRLPGWALVASYFVLEYFLYVTFTLTPGADTGVAYAAHVYGFIAGLVAGLAVYRVRWRAGIRLSDVH